jgi:peroxiredoxin
VPPPKPGGVMFRRSIILSLFVFCFAIIGYSEVIVKHGDRAPDFSLYDMKGKKFVLSSLKDKKMVLLNIFSIDCKPCIEELPLLSKISTKYSDKIHIVLISLDSEKIRLEKFVSDKKIEIQTCMDYTKSCINKYIDLKKENKIPINILIDYEGNIHAVYGLLQENEIIEVIEKMQKK